MYKVGDSLRIRAREDMERSGGFSYGGRISFGTGIDFVREMDYLCGKHFTVSSVEYDPRRRAIYHSAEGTEKKTNGGRWLITEDMLEYDREFRTPDINDETLSGLLLEQV